MSDRPPAEEAGPSDQELVSWLEEMVLIRAFEEPLEDLALQGEIPGGVHVASGQEAVAVGAGRALEPTDIVTTSHRPHHHAIAKGLDPDVIMAELFGRRDGCAGGRGGSMHLVDREKGLYPGNGIVGAAAVLAVGAALAASMDGREQVACAFIGDGAANTGRTWEAINLAVVWNLPVIVVCENNLYAVETSIASTLGGGSIARRAEGFGMRAVEVDGQDVEDVYRTVRDGRAQLLAGEGPTFIEARTYRYSGHSSGEATPYRTDDEVEDWRARDPIQVLATRLIERGALTREALEELRAVAEGRVDAAIDFARSSPAPTPATADGPMVGAHGGAQA